MYGYISIVFVSILVVFTQHAARVLYSMGYHIPIFPHTPGPCRVLDEVVGGSYSLTMLSNGTVLIATGSLDGGIYASDMSNLDGNVTLLKFSDNFAKAIFHPQSISSFTCPKTNKVTVFVVNHHPNKHCIEKFVYHEHRFFLEHIETIQDLSINFVDDIVAVSEDSYYFSNRFMHTDELSMQIERYAMFSWGTVVYYNGSNVEEEEVGSKKHSKGEVVTRGYMPSGLALSPDKRHLYVAGSQEIKVYRRSVSDESRHLVFVLSLPVEAHLGHINVDPSSGRLLIGAANSHAEYISHSQDARNLCGSRVFEVDADRHGMLGNLRELFANDGSELACATSAISYRNTLLIGAARAPPLLCKMNSTYPMNFYT